MDVLDISVPLHSTYICHSEITHSQRGTPRFRGGRPLLRARHAICKNKIPIRGGCGFCRAHADASRKLASAQKISPGGTIPPGRNMARKARTAVFPVPLNPQHGFLATNSRHRTIVFRSNPEKLKRGRQISPGVFPFFSLSDKGIGICGRIVNSVPSFASTRRLARRLSLLCA